ncbi:Uu.00g052900.m01.CDS01 [Anthostomella pinea]|uniref:Uu.00g052900.m01.CDS01 n=1 Tax=Anthostomella pinea TaxID=933095 RepID=A0AAI8YPI6_9PEZI|nr:Uu.00g052900.m01.CDS01 [Anthostomella pinea]
MARSMSLTPMTCLVFILSIFNVAAQAVDIDGVHELAPRQSPSADAASLPACQDYSRVANLSTIALNSTYRAAFLRSSPLGYNPASAILDTQSPKLTALMMDEALNKQCGNLSEVAMLGAAMNLSMNIVADLTITEAAGVDSGDIALPILSVAFILLFGGTWICL